MKLDSFCASKEIQKLGNIEWEVQGKILLLHLKVTLEKIWILVLKLLRSISITRFSSITGFQSIIGFQSKIGFQSIIGFHSIIGFQSKIGFQSNVRIQSTGF